MIFVSCVNFWYNSLRLVTNKQPNKPVEAPFTRQELENVRVLSEEELNDPKRVENGDPVLLDVIRCAKQESTMLRSKIRRSVADGVDALNNYLENSSSLEELLTKSTFRHKLPLTCSRLTRFSDCVHILSGGKWFVDDINGVGLVDTDVVDLLLAVKPVNYDENGEKIKMEYKDVRELIKKEIDRAATLGCFTISKDKIDPVGTEKLVRFLCSCQCHMIHHLKELDIEVENWLQKKIELDFGGLFARHASALLESIKVSLHILYIQTCRLGIKHWGGVSISPLPLTEPEFLVYKRIGKEFS